MPSGVEHFLAGQFKAWSQKERETRDAAPLPVITVSREYGALGAQMAHALGAQLGFAVWDQELLAAIAEKTGAEERFMASLDERRRSTIADIIEGALLGNAYMRSEYLQALMGVVHTIAQHGSAIVVGRGGNFILPSEDCLRVRVVRPLEERVADIAQRLGLSPKDARSHVLKLDRERLDYLHQHFKLNGAEPSHYDLLVNAGVFTTDEMANLVVQAYLTKFKRDPTR